MLRRKPTVVELRPEDRQEVRLDIVDLMFYHAVLLYPCDLLHADQSATNGTWPVVNHQLILA